jgi:hypothetical protein
MLFDANDIWYSRFDDDTRLVNISDAPQGWAGNERHFITFRDRDDGNPNWNSQPLRVGAVSGKEWIDPHFQYAPAKMSAQKLLKLIISILEVITNSDFEWLFLENPSEDMTRIIPESFIIMKFGGNEQVE